MEMVINMMTALAFIVIILISGGARNYFRRKYDPSVHIADVARAARRQQIAKQRLHNVSTK